MTELRGAMMGNASRTDYTQRHMSSNELSHSTTLPDKGVIMTFFSLQGKRCALNENRWAGDPVWWDSMDMMAEYPMLNHLKQNWDEIMRSPLELELKVSSVNDLLNPIPVLMRVNTLEILSTPKTR